MTCPRCLVVLMLYLLAIAGCRGEPSKLGEAAGRFRSSPRTHRVKEWEQLAPLLADRMRRQDQPTADKAFVEKLLGQADPKDMELCDDMVMWPDATLYEGGALVYMIEQDGDFASYAIIDCREPKKARMVTMLVASLDSSPDEHDKITREEKDIADSLGAININLGGGSHDGSAKPGYSLRLGGPQVTEPSIAKVARLTTLVSLSLSGPHVTDVILGRLSGHTYVASLTLRETGVTDAGLLQLRGCSGLKWLHIEGSSISPAAIEQLGVLLPRCEVEVNGEVRRR